MSQSKNPPAAEVADENEVAPNATDTSTRSPDQWAEILFPSTPTGRLHPDAWKHAGAEVLHGWKSYEARTGKKPVMSRANYEAAIAAASSNDLKPYAAADFAKKD